MNQFNKSLISKYSNLDANDGLSCYKQYPSQQHHNAYEVFFNLLNTVKPKHILEIGTALGGFTDFLNETMKNIGSEYKIRSYDIYHRESYENIRNNGVDIRIENIFSNTIPDDVIKFIQAEGLTIVLCDGGDKQNEFNVLSRYLKVNDIIMAHDYAPDVDYFQKNMNRKIWNWHEIQDSDIIESINNYGLHKHKDYSIFLDIAWGCFIKI